MAAVAWHCLILRKNGLILLEMAAAAILILSGTKDTRRHTKLYDETGKPLDAIDVFTHSIGYLKDHLYQSLKRSFVDLTPEDIKYVLTVPAIWNDNAKQLMREAATRAGIPNENLVLASEPEAAFLYCQHHAISDDDKQNMTHICRSSNAYMVVDIGKTEEEIEMSLWRLAGSIHLYEDSD